MKSPVAVYSPGKAKDGGLGSTVNSPRQLTTCFPGGDAISWKCLTTTDQQVSIFFQAMGKTGERTDSGEVLHDRNVFMGQFVCLPQNISAGWGQLDFF